MHCRVIFLCLITAKLCAFHSEGKKFTDVFLDALVPLASSFVPSDSSFGCAVADIGDIDGDGMSDLAVGASTLTGYLPTDPNKLNPIGNMGGVYVLLMDNSTRRIKSYTLISGDIGGGPSLSYNSFFGASIALFQELGPAGGSEGFTLIRGRFIGDGELGNDTNAEDNSTYNGPPIRYESKFGSAVANVGDMDRDGTPDLVVGALDASAGHSVVYVLFMHANGTVLAYSTIAKGTGGGPDVEPFSLFGSSLLGIGDVNGDGVPDLAIGSAGFSDEDAVATGAVYICLMTRGGTVASLQRVSRKSLDIPLVEQDRCGASLTLVKDVNADGMRDVVVGCTQSNALDKGRLLFLFLDKGGSPIGSSLMSTEGSGLARAAEFGSSLVVFGGMLVSGAAHEGKVLAVNYTEHTYYTKNTPPDFSVLIYVALPIIGAVLGCCLCVLLFLWLFRRKPDMVEVMVLQSPVVIGKSRTRKVRPLPAQQFIEKKVYVEHYEL